MFTIYLIIPVLCITLTLWLAVNAVKRGTSKKKAVVLQVCSTVALMLCCLFMPAKAAETPAEETSTSTSQSTEGEAARANAFGMGLVASALALGLAGIGGGIAVASAAPAAIAATSEDPKAFGKALIFVALGEGIALYGLLMSFLMYTQISQLKI